MIVFIFSFLFLENVHSLYFCWLPGKRIFIGIKYWSIQLLIQLFLETRRKRTSKERTCHLKYGSNYTEYHCEYVCYLTYSVLDTTMSKRGWLSERASSILTPVITGGKMEAKTFKNKKLLLWITHQAQSV